ncbi:hypothetical protein [Hydrocarboniphaga effusa]|uniref:hypothetical protein n=1 Tax=Hydrocarboniphaga effusa TaxID=243629 RepID=UPI003BAC38AE
MSHTCTAPSCTTVIADSKLMCWQHWQLVPGHLQRQVNDSWQATKRGNTQSRLQAINKYRVVRDQAIAAVEKMGPLA